MHYGLTIFPTDASISPADLAREAEARGFESLWFPEHSHIPASRKTPFPGGGDLPKMYYDVLEPFIALTSAAAATERIKLATGVCLVVQRDPLHTAKSVATLDLLSEGRFLFGVGAGWN
ncbi:MAG: LLM class flavin-dependent oxidoreductase, partial [Myxococcota bacterium]